METDVILKLVLGKNLENSQKLCKENGYICRITREDLHNNVGTCDLRFDRVNIEVDEGAVTNSYIG